MWNCSKTLLICFLSSSLVAGCATTSAALPPVAAAPTDAAEDRASSDESESEDTTYEVELALPYPEGWGPYHPPRLLLQIQGTDAAAGAVTTVERGFVLHRADIERFRILHARQQRCSEDLGSCELRVSELTTPQFWNRIEGRLLLGALGFAVGVGATVGIVFAVGR